MEEKFIVSARKYRPQNFKTVIGQEHITTTLKNAITHNQLAHAFLFCGPRGVGKTTCARILAKTINCTNKTADAEACNECESCVSFNNGSSMNIHELDAASNNSVDDIRALVETVRFAPQAGEYKVYIVDEVHMLSASAFNAFLKTLEEPPHHAIFILATTEKHKIIPTILSRCQIFDFKRITTEDTVKHLQEICEKEGMKAEVDALHVIAQKSDGAMRDALSILDKIASFSDEKITYNSTLEHLNILDEEYFFQFLDYMQKQELAETLLLHDTINNRGFEGDTLLEGLMEFFRNILISKDEKVISLLDVPANFKPKYLRAGQEVSTNWIIGAINILSEANINYKLAKNKKLFVELVLIKLCYLSQAVEISSGIEKKKLADQSRAVNFRQLPQKILLQGDKKSKAQHEKISHKPDQLNEPKLIIETPKINSVQQQSIETKQPVEKIDLLQKDIAVKTISSVAKLRQQIKNKHTEVAEPKPITDDELQKLVQELVFEYSNNERQAIGGALRLSKQIIINDGEFKFELPTVPTREFLVSESNYLHNYFQKYFQNPNLIIKFELDVEAASNLPVVQTPKEIFDEMAEENPMLLEMKKRLGLTLNSY